MMIQRLVNRILKVIFQNKVKNSIYIFLLALLVCSCSGEKENTTELKATQSDKLTLNSTSRIIQLETNPESLLGFILKINVDFSNDRIFVLSDFNIYIFNSNGKFLNKLKVGRGPGEIINIVAFTIDTETKLIYAIDNSIKLCIFNYDGNMINNYDIKSFPSSDISVLNDDNVFLLRNFVGNEEKYFVGLYNISAQKVVRKFVPAEKSPYPKNSLGVSCNFIQNKGKLYFCTPNVFGLFEYMDSDFHQILSLDIGKKSVPKSLSNKFEKHNYYRLRENAKSKNFIPFILYAFPFKGYYFIGADDKDINCYAINMQNNKIYNNGAISSYFNLPEKVSLRLPKGIQDSLIIFQCPPLEFFDSKTKVNAKEIQIAGHQIEVNQDDNPFLIIVNLNSARRFRSEH